LIESDIGGVLEWQGELAGALASYGDALAIRRGLPADNEADRRKDLRASLRAVANMLYATGKPRDALPLFDEAVSLGPDDAALFAERGRARLYAGLALLAVDDLAAATKLDPANAYDRIWLHISRSRAQRDDRDELVEGAAKLDRNAWPWPVVAMFLGDQAREATKAAAAAAEVEKERREHSREANFYTGVEALDTGDTDAARASLEAAAANCPHDFDEYRAVPFELLRLLAVGTGPEALALRPPH